MHEQLGPNLKLRLTPPNESFSYSPLNDSHKHLNPVQLTRLLLSSHRHSINHWINFSDHLQFPVFGLKHPLSSQLSSRVVQ